MAATLALKISKTFIFHREIMHANLKVQILMQFPHSMKSFFFEIFKTKETIIALFDSRSVICVLKYFYDEKSAKFETDASEISLVNTYKRQNRTFDSLFATFKFNVIAMFI